VLVQDDDTGDTFAIGLPMDEIQRIEHSLLLWASLLALAGVILAGLIGTPLVRRQLRPLREVADTAYEVTAMPLDSGGQTIEARVAEPNTDPTTEVGRVGSALNTLLDHVDAALDARHRSELQVRQFVADASHELRTPLSTIHGYAELSRRTPEDAAALSNAMDKVETEATRMSSLVGDMLLLARLDSGRPLEREEVDLTRLLLEAVTDARVVAPGHHWRLDLPDEPVTVTGDEHRLHQVVTNLINNARRHTPNGSTVTVGARPGAGAGEPVTITVHDDGPGIPDDLAGHVFERFTRGDTSRTRTSGGAGLGLSLVQAITEAHGGTARVESRPGSTTFTVSLP
jgi:two-component system, OmpR family, sensor kinase